MQDSLLEQLNSGNDTQQEAAVEELRVCPPYRLLSVIEAEVAQYRRNMRRGGTLLLTVLTAYLFGWFAWWLNNSSESGLTIIAGACGFVLLWVIIGVAFLFEPRAQRLLAERFADEEITSPGVALRLLSLSEEERLCSVLRKRVGPMLKNLRADQGRTWSVDERQALRTALLRFRFDEEFICAALSGLEQIGTPEDISTVTELTRPRNTPRIIAAAQNCLAYLKIRDEDRKTAQTLLRASIVQENAPDTLLRAATPAPDTTAQSELLRPQS